MLLKDKIPMGYIFGKIKYELLAVAVYSMVIAALFETLDMTAISIPIAVPTIIGTVISLLLAFRSNQAYDRWWEARTIWGAVVNDSRSLTRQILSFTVSDEYQLEELEHFRAVFVKRQIAWSYSLGQALRKMNAVHGLDRLLSKRELNYISRYDNVPAALLELHGRDLAYALQKGWINAYQHVELDRTLTRLCDSMGKCERIKNTIFPATYSLYIHFANLFFILLLPFAVIDFMGYMEVPLVIAISASFLLIEKMAIQLQDPFENKPTDTPMTTIARSIEKDLRQMLNEHPQVPEVHPVYKFYVL
jgi:putative membrane protein